MPEKPTTPPTAPTGSACLPVEDTGNRCVQCGYNLTGLTTDTCPECGWQIDWKLAQGGVDGRRVGTLAHRARGWRKVDQTLLTVLEMLFTPWRFARQVRSDEAIWPSLIVATLCYLSMILPDVSGWKDLLPEILNYLPPISAVILGQSLVFATMCSRPSADWPRWYARFRLWLIVSFYSTCFVASWRSVGEPPLVSSPFSTNFAWPLDSTGLVWRELGVTVIFYWWWIILAAVLIIRNRPRWLAGLLIPLVFLFAWLGYAVGERTVEIF